VFPYKSIVALNTTYIPFIYLDEKCQNVIENNCLATRERRTVCAQCIAPPADFSPPPLIIDDSTNGREKES
jgi:hypothetical protein